MNPRIQEPAAHARFELVPIQHEHHATALGLVTHPSPTNMNLPHVEVISAWLEAPLDDDWCVALQIAIQNGRPVVSELRVFPAEVPAKLVRTDGKVATFSSKTGTWAGDWLGVNAKVPKGGLTSTIVRRAKIPLHTKFFEEIRQDIIKRGGQDFFAAEFGFPEVPQQRPPGGTTKKRRPGRPPVPCEELLSVAQDYAAVVAAGSRKPLQDVAQTRGRGVEEIRRRVFKARREGLLSPTHGGVGEGVLTAQAKRLIQKSRRGKRMAGGRNTTKKVQGRRLGSS